MNKRQSNYIFIIIVLLLVTVTLFYTNSKIAFDKIENIKVEKYNTLAKNTSSRVNTLINDKKNSTLALALLLAENPAIKQMVKNHDIKDLKLSKSSLKLRKYSKFKNVWFHIVDKKGTSVYRSWVKKRGDSLLKARLDIVKMLEEPKIMSTISVGKFDMTFKSMVPMYDENGFSGIVEIITHFNSIAKELEASHIDPVILVNKHYKEQITKPFTKLFVDDYYVANFNAKPELMSFIQEVGVDGFIDKNDHMILNNYFISFYNLPDIKNKPMGHFVLFQKLDNIDITEIESFKLVSKIIIATLLALLFIGLLLIYIFAKKGQTEQLNKVLAKNNEELEERIQAQVEKNRKTDMLLQRQSRLVALGEMLENIAHQWRQPLSAISTTASGLQLKYEFNDKKISEQDLNESINSVIENTNYLSNTIEDFRSFFKKDKSKKQFNVAKTIHSTFNIIKALYNKHNIQTSFNLDESVTYNGYERELSQVILNLLNNAKDALIDNKDLEYKLVNIVLKKCSEEKYVLLSITDNGGGIPESLKDKIFDPYFTTKHKSQGTGIGLYMSQEIIIDHFGGEIYASNKEIEMGNEVYNCARFIVTLPIEEEN